MKNIKIEDIDYHVAERLKKFRFEAGMSQTKLAESIGVSFQQIQKYESVKNKISIARLFEFSKVLQISIAAFFDGAGYRDVQCGFVNKSFVMDDAYYSIQEIKEYLPLIKAYGKIDNENIRKNILDLVQNISKLGFDNQEKSKI